jgi:hypothetical protein
MFLYGLTFFMQWTDLVGHLNLSAVCTHKVFISELIGLIRLSEEIQSFFLLSFKFTHNIYEKIKYIGMFLSKNNKIGKRL